MRALVTLVLLVLAPGCCSRRPGCPAPAAPPPAAPRAAAEEYVVEIYAVADLVHAVEVLGGRVDIGSPEEAPMERLLFTLAITASHATPDAVPSPISELRAQGGTNLLVKATSAEQRAIGELLATWRTSWRARWPEAFPAQ